MCWVRCKSTYLPKTIQFSWDSSTKLTDQPPAHVCILDLGHDATNFSELSRQRSDFVGNFLVVLHHRVLLLVPCTIFSPTFALLCPSFGLCLWNILIRGRPITRRKGSMLWHSTGLREGARISFVGKQPLPGQGYRKGGGNTNECVQIEFGR